jgi:hypothetical protein
MGCCFSSTPQTKLPEHADNDDDLKKTAAVAAATTTGDPHQKKKKKSGKKSKTGGDGGAAAAPTSAPVPVAATGSATETKADAKKIAAAKAVDVGYDKNRRTSVMRVIPKAGKDFSTIAANRAARTAEAAGGGRDGGGSVSMAGATMSKADIIFNRINAATLRRNTLIATQNGTLGKGGGSGSTPEQGNSRSSVIAEDAGGGGPNTSMSVDMGGRASGGGGGSVIDSRPAFAGGAAGTFAPDASSLMPWKIHTDATSGSKYYEHRESGEVTWERPEVLGGDSDEEESEESDDDDIEMKLPPAAS